MRKQQMEEVHTKCESVRHVQDLGRSPSFPDTTFAKLMKLKVAWQQQEDGEMLSYMK